MPEIVDVVGRDEQLNRLAARIAELAHGRGGVVWVSGEAGIGKSSLVAAALGKPAAAGGRAWWAAGDGLSAPTGLRLLLEAIPPDTDGRQQILDLLAGRRAGTDAIRAASERIISLFDRECTQAPLVLVADDLQWADGESLDCLLGLFRVASQGPLLIIAMARPLPEPDALARLHAAALRNGRATSLTLLPLDEASMTRIAEVRCSGGLQRRRRSLCRDGGRQRPAPVAGPPASLWHQTRRPSDEPTPGHRLGGSDGDRAHGGSTRRRRAVQPGDRQPPVRLPPHGRDPRRAHPGQARPAQPR